MKVPHQSTVGKGLLVLVFGFEVEYSSCLYLLHILERCFPNGMIFWEAVFNLVLCSSGFRADDDYEFGYDDEPSPSPQGYGGTPNPQTPGYPEVPSPQVNPQYNPQTPGTPAM